MELLEYLEGERGRRARIAQALKIAPAYLSQMASGVRPVPPALAPTLCDLCEQQVPLWQLRPQDWWRIWPNLKGADGAPTPPADEVFSVA